MAEDAGDAPEQVDVDILFPEYLVNIGACAAQLGSEPGDGASLFVKRAFNKLSRMNHVPILLMCVPQTPVGRTIQSIVDRNIQKRL